VSDPGRTAYSAFITLGLAVLYIAASSEAAANAVDPASDIGRRIYVQGAGIVSGEDSTRADAEEPDEGVGSSQLACSGCHGRDGAGGGEGYQKVPSLRWPDWVSVDAEVREQAFRRLEIALMHGAGKGGRVLSPAMPRYRLSAGAIREVGAYLTSLTVNDTREAAPTFIVFERADGKVASFEQEVSSNLRRCLDLRIGQRARVEVRQVADHEAFDGAWEEVERRMDVVAALAPPWRTAAPATRLARRSAAAGVEPLVALFPIVADPLPGATDVMWLFGGERARALALIQAAIRDRATPVIRVWTGIGEPSERRWREVQGLSDSVERATGRKPKFTRLRKIQATTASPTLWYAPGTPRSNGWWLVPQADTKNPSAEAVWWRASPYVGQSRRSLSTIWAEATCVTMQAVLARAPDVDRSSFYRVLVGIGRLNNGLGWEWRIEANLIGDQAASANWSIRELLMDGIDRIRYPMIEGR